VPDGLATAAAMAGAVGALRPVLSLHARAVRVADLPAGHGVGYGPVFFAQRPSRIATLALGYGDGWHRILTGRASALVRGMRVPLVGRVSMDAVMADVTDIPGSPVHEDDEFVLIGAQDGARITAYEVASAAGTISYEVVTAVSRRVARVYDAAGSVAGLRTLTE
jgi:alanine racemase